MLGVAAFGVADVLAGDGVFDLARAGLDAITLPATTADTVGLLSALAVIRALLAVVSGHPGDAGAAMDTAADMAERFGELGEADPLGFGFGPTNVGFRRVRLALEAGEPDRAVSIAEGLHPEQNPFPLSRVYHWVGYGRSLAQLRGRHDDAVVAKAALINIALLDSVSLSLAVYRCCCKLYARRRRGVEHRVRGGRGRAGSPRPVEAQRVGGQPVQLGRARG
ncbi:MAG: hypothetical protein ACT4NY_20940 [Pseudonocardiales bacterium]